MNARQKRRMARLKCVVFLTENPDVAQFFKIAPLMKLKAKK